MLTWMSQRSRWPFAISLIIILGLLGFASYLQVYQALEPCPLCVLQRILFAGLAIIFLVAFLHNPQRRGRVIYYIATLIVAMLGNGVASRHIWIENLPRELVPSCGPSWDVLVENFPLYDVLTIALRGSGDCAQATWHFLGLSIAGWSLVWFVLFTVFAVRGIVVSLRGQRG